MQFAEFVKVDDKVLVYMMSKVWCDLEQPIVACPIEYKINEEPNYNKGYLMITRGAHYLFKGKMFKGCEFVAKFNLLEVNIIDYSDTTILFELEKSSYQLLSENYIQTIATATDFVMKTATFGVNNIHTYKLRGEKWPESQIQERPENAMKWRSIFLAHFYDIKGEQLFTVDYFNKWEDKQTSMMIVGPSLHPGNFAGAFGHSIAWESKLSTVLIQSFTPSKFAGFFEALVSNSITIKKLAFTDYSNPDKYPKFPNYTIQRSSIQAYQFMRCIAPIVTSFFENVKNIPQIDSLILQKITINEREFAKLGEYASKNDTMSRTTRFVEISNFDIKKIPMNDVTRFVNAFMRLETIAIRHMNGDGIRYLHAICRSTSPIRSIHINCMNFRRPFKPDLSLPQTLMLLDVSFSAFTEEAYMTILYTMTKHEMITPIIFESCSISVDQPEMFELLMEIDFEHCFPNIAEFNYSGNHFPQGESSRYMFAYLFTQKNLRMLTMNSLKCDDQVDFLNNMMTLVTSISLPGLQLSGNFDKEVFSNFLEALASHDTSSYRSFAFKFTNAGIRGLNSLAKLVSKCKNLVEITADGFKPEQEINSEINSPTKDSNAKSSSSNDGVGALENFWIEIGNNESILACDLPDEDLKHLSIIPTKMSSEFQDAFEKIKNKSRPSTTGKRYAYVLNDLMNGGRLFSGPKIFQKCATFDEEDPENDFVTKRMNLYYSNNNFNQKDSTNGDSKEESKKK
ncbi:hypothetical protein TRFO_26296 [Tritrichomonas foetus]|uniref:Uncharacterized protein n=1 Tax=Tritrichomonas foetus TaxID=1144522 RepID=A0A1J4K3U9_9EUKA|nr:hypothetical protein TRFO_26296 [Tritrichomonas foetus]|eukprot:OHT05859.1 hypothetical protein TRFO_26296 [Tritrichomonas foetus]